MKKELILISSLVIAAVTVGVAAWATFNTEPDRSMRRVQQMILVVAEAKYDVCGKSLSRAQRDECEDELLKYRIALGTIWNATLQKYRTACDNPKPEQPCVRQTVGNLSNMFVSDEHARKLDELAPQIRESINRYK